MRDIDTRDRHRDGAGPCRANGRPRPPLTPRAVYHDGVEALELRRGADEPGRDGDREADEDLDDRERGRRIRCPRCGWQPRPKDRWSCMCGHAWNTFDTAGICPACGEQWDHTQCLRCAAWSPHVSWYERPDVSE